MLKAMIASKAAMDNTTEWANLPSPTTSLSLFKDDAFHLLDNLTSSVSANLDIYVRNGSMLLKQRNPHIDE